MTRRELINHFPPLAMLGGAPTDPRLDDMEGLLQFVTGVWIGRDSADFSNATITTSLTAHASAAVSDIPEWATKLAALVLCSAQMSESTSTQNLVISNELEGVDYASREQTVANGETHSLSTSIIQLLDRPSDGEVNASIKASVNDHNSTTNAGSVQLFVIGIRPSTALEAIA